MSSWEFIGRKLKASWQHFTIADDEVRNNFINRRFTVNSSDCLLRESNGHASVAYSSIGRHLTRIRFNTTSSEASRPTLLNKALKALKKHDFALSKLHLKVEPLLKIHLDNGSS